MRKMILLAAATLMLMPGAALAGDAPGEVSVPVPAGFAGFYAGVNAGYGVGTFSDANNPAAFPNVTLKGTFVGAQAGYNFPITGGLVAGLQGDLGWANEKGSTGATTMQIGPVYDATLSDTINWTGALTGHIGFTANGMMIYALGGLAAAGNSLHNVGNDGNPGLRPLETDATQTQIGWTAGAGVSALLGPVETFLEYRYSDYGNTDYTSELGSSSVNLNNQSVRIGFNYHMY